MLRFIKQVVGAGVGSLPLLIVLAILRAWPVLVILAMPVEGIGRAISSWMDATWPPQTGGWFPGLGRAILVDAVLVWLYVWLLSIVVLRLRVFFREKKENRNEA